MRISIDTEADWQKLAADNLRIVLDPMLLRCGELFLQGAAGAAVGREAAWNVLTANPIALGMFFDALILNERIPVFNYGDTFDMHLDFDKRVFARINETTPVLYDVNVGYSAYNAVKSAAVEELAKVTTGPGRIPPALGKEVLAELDAADYQWDPGLGELEGSLPTDDDRRVAAFLLGGLIFGGYAQEIGGDHLLQPKRARTFLAISLGRDTIAHRFDDDLFGELKKRATLRTDDAAWTPTFFPYLLSKSSRPSEVLDNVLRLRNSPEVSDYRQWMAEVTTNWKRDGRVSVDHIKDVRAIARAIDMIVGTVPSAPKIELKATVADVIAHKPPGEIDFTPAVERLWGWILASLPGKRYRKLLTRAIVADTEYRRMENAIKTIWES